MTAESGLDRALHRLVPRLLTLRGQLRHWFVPALSPGQRAARDELVAGIRDGRFPLEALPRCYLCHAERAAVPLCGYERFGVPHQTLLCARCGLSYTSPRFTPVALERLYAGLYWRMTIGDEPLKVSPAATARGARILGYVASQLKAPRERLVVEVGCGGGWNLVAFQRAGFRALGFDPDGVTVAKGRAAFGLDLRVGSAEEALLAGPKADLLILSHVLEHVLDPIGYLESLKPLLNEQSLLYVEVPGLLNLDIPSYRADVMNYLQAAHSFNFTRATLSQLLDRAGFQVIQADESVQLLASLPGAGTSEPTEARAQPTDGPLCEEADATLRYLLRSEATRLARKAQRRFAYR